jgi:DNA repair protein RecO (recombination protein O)
MSQILEDVGFVIHSRRYRENSRIVEIFTREHGRIALVARIPAKRGGREMAALQPHGESLFSWRGRHDLQNLVNVDAREKYQLEGENGICGLYCNELILYLLDKQLPIPALYDSYKTLMQRLNTQTNPAISLRQFEGELLHQLGFSLDFASVQKDPDKVCYFHPENGLSYQREENSTKIEPAVLANLAGEDYASPEAARAAKTIFGSTIHKLLEGKPLRSRALMQSYRKYTS